MAENNAVLEEACLGIDNGSTSARLFLYTQSGREIVVECDQFGDHSCFEPGDFSSSCYPFQENLERGPYIGNAVDKNREAMSLKPALLLLSDVDPAYLRSIVLEYPHGEQVLGYMAGSSRNHRRFRANLKKALSEFAKALGARLAEACQKERLQVTSVGFAVPAHWPCAVEATIWEKVLQKLIKASTNIRFTRDTVFFHSETQALAHHLFRHCSRKSLKVPPSPTGGTFCWPTLAATTSFFHASMIADAGFFAQNISTYHAEYAGNGVKAFYQTDVSTGVAGVGEMMDYYIGEHCEEVLVRQGRTLSRRQKQSLINDFHRRKREPDFDDATENRAITLHGPAGIDVPLTDGEINEAFEKAMEGPWTKFAEVLQSQAHLNDAYAIQVIVSGGTSRSQAVKDRVINLCRNYGYEDPIFSDELTMHISARYPSLSVAKGAAYATASSVTIEEFINRGAAIGVQLKQNGQPVWDSRAEFLCRKDAVTPQTIRLEEGDELKLICQPFWSPHVNSRTLSYTRSYDMFDIGMFKAGEAKIAARFAPAADNPEVMKIDLCVMWHRELDREPQETDWICSTLELPLKFDRSSSCVLVDEGRVTGCLPLEVQAEPQAELQAGDNPGVMNKDVGGRDTTGLPTVTQPEAPGVAISTGTPTGILRGILRKSVKDYSRQSLNTDRQMENSGVGPENSPARHVTFDQADDYSAYDSEDDAMDLNYTPQQ